MKGDILIINIWVLINLIFFITVARSLCSQKNILNNSVLKLFMDWRVPWYLTGRIYGGSPRWRFGGLCLRSPIHLLMHSIGKD